MRDLVMDAYDRTQGAPTVGDTSYTETFDLTAPFAIAELALGPDVEDRLRTALAEHPQASEIEYDIEQEINTRIQRYGVDAETGEWFGDWSAADVVTAVLDRYEPGR